MNSNAASEDAQLVQLGVQGDRDAFGRLVARYQSPVCAFAYSACGNVSQSEDLAQETFIIAWRKLGDLREPEKFKAWLFGIARNLINHTARKQTRNPLATAALLDENIAAPAPAPSPAGHAISKEEEEILWRSLERIPESYREPLVLFYREHQSVEQVAATLDLSEEATRQRLSRGRKLLHEEIMAFVEGALARTNPGQAFTLGVLAALPITLASSAKAATIAAAAAKGGASATGASFSSVVLGMLASPALGFLAGFLGWREQLKFTRTARERALIKRSGALILVCGILFFAACWLYGEYLAPRLWNRHSIFALALVWVLCLSWVVFAFAVAFRQNRMMRELREKERQAHPELFRGEPSPQAWEYRSRATLFGLPLVHLRSFGHVRKPGEKVQPAVGWIAIGEKAYGILYASGAVAVGGISVGACSVGLFAFGGASFGLFAFGGLAVGMVAMGGGAIGWVASGGLALAWHSALGGMVAARELACGGAALANHANDPVAVAFFQRHRSLDFTQAGPRNVFWLLCFGPIFIQMLISTWWRRRIQKRAKQI